jgi:hypothetical protein
LDYRVCVAELGPSQHQITKRRFGGNLFVGRIKQKSIFFIESDQDHSMGGVVLSVGKLTGAYKQDAWSSLGQPTPYLNQGSLAIDHLTAALAQLLNAARRCADI